jgi:hypothetical protein
MQEKLWRLVNGKGLAGKCGGAFRRWLLYSRLVLLHAGETGKRCAGLTFFENLGSVPHFTWEVAETVNRTYLGKNAAYEAVPIFPEVK